MKKSFLIIFFMAGTFAALAQNNCNKIPFYLANHIRNPSLEETENCFTALNDNRPAPLYSVISDWRFPMNINNAGIVYFGECNKFTFPYDYVQLRLNPGSSLLFYPYVPQPIPNGKGVIGLLDQAQSEGNPELDPFATKSYIATFLKRPLKKDSLYRLSFYIGFGKKNQDDSTAKSFFQSVSPFKVSIFGLADSTHIPFTNLNPKYNANCLTTTSSEWVTLGSAVVFGETGTWVKDSIMFTAPSDMQVFAIGPACDYAGLPRQGGVNGRAAFYYFLDHLQFYQSTVPQVITEISKGSLCDSRGAFTTLHMVNEKFYQGSQLQWYKNGVAINETGASVTITKTQYGEGYYQCGVTNDSVCALSDSLKVSWAPAIGASIGTNADTTVCEGDSLYLKIDGGPGASYLWSNGSNTNTSYLVRGDGNYSVQVTNACGTFTASKNIVFTYCSPTFDVPSAFTPNNDGLNDVFRAHAKGKMLNFKLSIYNRSGQQIFYSNDIAKGWDGKVKRMDQGQGTYLWVINYIDGLGAARVKTGTLVLIR